jgi:hypothetical protein
MVTSRIWFTAVQKAELWKRWKNGRVSMAAGCCARRYRAQSSSLFIPCRSRATSAAPNNTRGWRRSADGGFAWSVELR